MVRVGTELLERVQADPWVTAGSASALILCLTLLLPWANGTFAELRGYEYTQGLLAAVFAVQFLIASGLRYARQIDERTFLIVAGLPATGSLVSLLHFRAEVIGGPDPTCEGTLINCFALDAGIGAGIALAAGLGQVVGLVAVLRPLLSHAEAS